MKVDVVSWAPGPHLCELQHLQSSIKYSVGLRLGKVGCSWMKGLNSPLPKMWPEWHTSIYKRVSRHFGLLGQARDSGGL